MNTSTITVRVNDLERKAIEEEAKFQGVGISNFIKKTIFEKLENEYDLKIINEFEQDEINGLIEYTPYEEFVKEYDL